jgi:hypothetical protein
MVKDMIAALVMIDAILRIKNTLDHKPMSCVAVGKGRWNHSNILLISTCSSTSKAIMNSAALAGRAVANRAM